MYFYCLLFAAVTVLATLFLSKILSKKNGNSAGRKEAPPEPQCSWPIIGHLHLLTRSTTPAHRLLAMLAEQYGPVITLRLGVGCAVVVSSWELAKECFTTHDRVFASRPMSVASKLMGYDHAMLPTSPYGPLWRDARKIVTLKLLSNRQLELLKHVRAFEVDTVTREMFGLWVNNGRNPVRVEMKQLVEDLLFNMIMHIVVGKRNFDRSVPEADKESFLQFRALMKECLKLYAVASSYDALPWLEWVDVTGNVRAMKRVGKEMDLILQGWIDERRSRKIETDEHRMDFLDILLNAAGEGDITTICDADRFVKATALAMIIGAVATSSAAMVWALTLVLKNPQILKKTKDELDSFTGKHRMVDESDIHNLKYLQCVVKETLRLYPSGPLLLSRESIEDCSLGGFHIRRGTCLLVNAWKIHRDPNLWKNPEEFDPERFMKENIDYGTARLERFLPFGSGRRSCPGINLALQALHLILARFLQSFDMVSPPDVDDIDLHERFAISLVKLNPLPVLCQPRLPVELYG